jgi:hypothetical protein
MLENMCELIKTGIRSDKGLKHVHLPDVSKALFEHFGSKVMSTQVYNHMRKWRLRWIHISNLRDLSGSPWDEDISNIMLEVDYYQGYITIIIV